MTKYTDFNLKSLSRAVSTILLFEGVAMLPSLLYAFFGGEETMARVFAVMTGVMILVGAVGYRRSRFIHLRMNVRNNYFLVLVCWLTVIVTGIFPYMCANKGYSLIDSIFESVAAWTTSCATVININTMPRSLVLWRATTNWLGGMGVILIALLVFRSVGKRYSNMDSLEFGDLLRAEQRPRARDTVWLTFRIYAGLSIVEFALLLIGGLSVFESAINTMSSISTSGVIDYRNELSNNFSPYIKIVLALFSLAASFNVIVYTNIAKKRYKHATGNYESKLFLKEIVLSTVVIGVILIVSGHKTPIKAFVDAFVGVVSFASTSGFPLERVTFWPPICQMILLILMLIGGCTNSTSGGIKVIRAAVAFKIASRGMYKRIHPNSMKPVMTGGKAVSPQQATSISTYVLLFLAVYLITAGLLSFENLDMETTLSAPISLLTSTGVGFGRLWGADYSIFSPVGRLFCAFVMMVGRLELYTILLLFSRSFWNYNKAHV